MQPICYESHLSHWMKDQSNKNSGTRSMRFRGQITAIRITVNLLAIFVVSLICYGQWSVDPSMSGAITDTNGWDQVHAIASDGRGGAFITWWYFATHPG